MKADAAKMKDELKLRKQAIKESKYKDSIILMSISVMSLAYVVFYEEKKASSKLKRFGYPSSTEEYVFTPPY